MKINTKKDAIAAKRTKGASLFNMPPVIKPPFL